MVGSPDDLLPDRGPVAARQALAAADALRTFDGRATVWVVVQRLLEVAGFVLIFLGALYGGMLVGQWVWVAVGLAVVVLAYEGPVAPLAGAEPKRWRTRWRVLLVAVVMVLILLRGMGALGSWVAANDLVFPVALAGMAIGYLLAPVVRWALSLRRPGGTTAWPDGAQGFAVLSVLAGARWVHPHRLSVLTGLSRDRCDDWVRACAARGLAVPAARGRVFLRNAEITAVGLARLDAWTSELTRRAASPQPWADSTAPTSADVIVDSSSSEVT